MTKIIDLTGRKFDKLTVIEFGERKNGNLMWLCECVCGTRKLVRGSHLTAGKIRSCGCFYKTPPNKTHGMKDTKLYAVWSTMRERCRNPNRKDWKRYGGRGITVCEEWQRNFIPFYNWAMANGYKEGLSIDRVDVNGNYEPKNCKWSTPKEQSNNRRSNRFIEFNGKTQTLMQWAEEYRISEDTLSGRLKSGWPIGKALTFPAKKGNNKATTS